MARRDSFKVTGPSEQFIVPVLEREIHLLLEVIDLPKVVTVLDIGCGNQPMRKIIEQNGWAYKSMDVSQNDFCNVDILGKIDDDINVTEKFDLLLITEVMEHVLFWEKAFANLQTLCKPSGKVLLTCPFFYPLHEEPHDYWRASAYALKTFATKFGFAIVQQHKAGSMWDVLGTLLNSMHITQHEKMKFYHKLKIRMLLNIIRYLKKQIGSKQISEYANAEGNWYLSNVMLLKKIEV